MIKVCNNKRKSIKIGSVTIPAYGSVLLATLPSVSDVNRLTNKGIISVFYVKDETIDTTTENKVENTNKTDVVEEVNNSVTTESANDIPETPVTSTRKRRTHKETVSLIDNTTTDETNEPNTTKGDMNNASD